MDALARDTAKLRFKTRADSIAWSCLLIAICCAIVLTGLRVLHSEQGRVIIQDSNAPWIMVSLPFSINIRQWRRTQTPINLFTRNFELPLNRTESVSWLWARSFGQMELRINGHPLALGEADPAQWRNYQRWDVSSLLHAGTNRLEAGVTNFVGPGLFSARLEVGPKLIKTDSDWTASIGRGQSAPAMLAEDRRIHPDAELFASPVTALRLKIAWLGVAFLCAGLMFWGLQRHREGYSIAMSPLTLGIVIGLAWAWLLIVKFAPQNPEYGFDARGHLAYVAFIIEHRRLPMASDGWSMYHPPLYYLISAAVHTFAAPFGASAWTFAQRLPAFFAALGSVAICFQLAKRLFPSTRAVAACAVLFAAVLPMNLYLAAFFSNESLLAFLSAGALWSATGVLLSPVVRIRSIGVLSLWLGLALLTKYTALVMVLVVLAFIIPKLMHCTLDREGRWRAWAWLCVPMLLLAGGVYLRNWWHFDTVLIGNWNLPGSGKQWWSPPGFHTPDYYLSFGEVFIRPYFSALNSFWDSLYSTLWGDGLLAGGIAASARYLAWNYQWMSVGYLAAIPICLIISVGFIGLTRDVLLDPSGSRRAAIALPIVFFLAMGFSIFFATLSLPYFGQAKAFYGLSATPVLALAFARGITAVDHWLANRAGPTAQIGLRAVTACLLLTFYLAYAA